MCTGVKDIVLQALDDAPLGARVSECRCATP